MTIETPSEPTGPSPAREISALTHLPDTVKSLAKGCKDKVDGTHVQACISIFVVII